jgi:hypothetical protein
MPTYKVLIEQVKPTGGVAHRETVKVSADNEAQAIRESDFVRTLRFIGGEYEKRVTVLGVCECSGGGRARRFVQWLKP